MVFMTMGDEKGFDLSAIVFQMGVIRDDIIDSRQGGRRKFDPGVNEDNRAIGFKAVCVLANFS